MAVKIKQPENEPEIAVEILAQSIIRMDEAVKKIKSSGLKDRAIILLLDDSSRVGFNNCAKVLRALQELRTNYTTR